MDLTWQSVSGLSKHVLDVVEQCGFQNMLPVQAATIPVFLKNKDVCVEAVTGSGKTLAFVVPLLEMLQKRKEKLKKHQIGALIVSPTRELACQIHEVVKSFYHAQLCPYTSMLCIGGKGDIQRDCDQFSEDGAQILVGTPGRISAALEKSSLMQTAIKALEVYILDEADRLLDMGFHNTLSSIMSRLPKQRRTGLFSATQTEQVEQLIKAGMRNPVKIIVKEKKEVVDFASDSTSVAKTPSSLLNQYMICPANGKFNCLMDFINKRKNEKILVFVSTCASVEYFGRAIKDLIGKTINILLLHGKVKKRRLQIFSNFRQITSGVLICTDVMSRGIDIPDVDWVLQFDPPSNASAFVHRCGRTARVGRQGSALTFLLDTEAAYVDFIEINQKAPMKEYVPETPVDQMEDWLARLRHLAVEDRAVMERGTRAFVSFVQSYVKHECNLIFRVKDLNLGELATGFALLRLPKMPELKNKKITGFTATDVNFSSIKFKEKSREKFRQEEMKRRANGVDTRGPKFMSKKAKAWSDNKLKKESRKEKKMKRLEKKNKMTFDENELEELRKDAQMVKKLKNNKISKDAYNQEIESEESKMEKEKAEKTQKTEKA